MDLTTLARYKAYMGVTNTTSDALFASLITRASGQISQFCSRVFNRKTHVDAILDGTGTATVMLPDAPVITVSALTVCNVAQVLTTDRVSGFDFDESKLYLLGGAQFPYLRRAVKVSYISGFNVSDTQDVPAAAPYTISPTAASGNDGAGYPDVDKGVTNALTGVALAKVAAAPTSGQYSFSAGVYTFAAADANLSVTMTYDYIPSSVEQACIELVAMKVKQRDTIGISSKSLAGEAISYTDRDMSKSVQSMLKRYNRRVPI